MPWGFENDVFVAPHDLANAFICESMPVNIRTYKHTHSRGREHMHTLLTNHWVATFAADLSAHPVANGGAWGNAWGAGEHDRMFLTGLSWGCGRGDTGLAGGRGGRGDTTLLTSAHAPSARS